MILFKLVLIAALALVSHSIGHLRVKLTGADFSIDPEYGNVTKSADNATHLGTASLTFFRKISNFSDTKVLTQVGSNKPSLSKTTLPCDVKSMKRAKTFVEKALKIFGRPEQNDMDHPQDISCPLQKGTITFGAKPKTFDLPMVVPSFLATPGSYKLTSSMSIIMQGGSKTILSTVLRFQIQQIDIISFRL